MLTAVRVSDSSTRLILCQKRGEREEDRKKEWSIIPPDHGIHSLHYALQHLLSAFSRSIFSMNALRRHHLSLSTCKQNYLYISEEATLIGIF